MTSPLYVLYDPYVLLVDWRLVCEEVELPYLADSLLYIIDRGPYYEAVPLHFSDDDRGGYESDVSSVSSDSRPSGPPPLPVVAWGLPARRPPRVCDVGCNTEICGLQAEVDGTGEDTLHGGQMWKCVSGIPHCHYGIFRCYRCFRREDMEYNSSENSDSLGPLPIDYSESGLSGFCTLEDFLGKGSGTSAAGVRPSSSVGAVRPLGHNSDSSLARFDGGAHYSGDLGLVVRDVAGGVLVARFHLGLED